MASVFQGVIDRWDGVTVDSLLEPCDTKDFPDKLNFSLEKWHKENRRCIWFRINIKHSELIPILAKEEFKFHHSKDDFLMMFKWLPQDSRCNLPPASHTNLGVGGMVFNKNNQLLVVTEKFHSYQHWKLPGGYVERGEDIKDAVIREVKEETGIDTTFESLVTFRHTHNTTFQNSDIYVVVMLSSVSDVITRSETEIAACKWMDVDEFLQHPEVIDFNKLLVSQALDLKKRKIKLDLQKKKITVRDYSRDITALVIEDF